MKPEEAVERARAAAARRRAGGGYALDVEPGALAAGEPVTREQLLEWALIEPDPGLVRSTRRYGAPITWAKRGLVHVLRQYFTEAHAQQTRFNLHMVAAWTDLEARVAALEETAAERKPRPPA
ncbi:MAG TPA: hypothetical protein VF533_19090 [Solirubrobacteraceae bacterium]